MTPGIVVRGAGPHQRIRVKMPSPAVTVRGWVNALRLQRAIQFLIARDSSGLAQVTHKRGGHGDEIEQVIESLTEESAVAVTGRVAGNPVVNLGGLEIIPEQVEVLGRAEAPLPVDEHSGPEHRLDWRFLDVRKRPVFRAEPSFTSRHCTEFTGVDVEMAWIDGVEDVMAFEEQMLAHALAAVADRHGEMIAEVYGTEVTVPKVPFPRLTMAEALEIMRGQGWDPQREKNDLDPEGERGIAAHVAAQTGHEFVFVTRFPSSVRPFYHMRPEGRPDLTFSFDLLWRGLEITTGAQREHRYHVLARQAADKGMDTEPMAGYVNAFRYGCPPHGGLGMGLGRVLMVLLGLDSIRDATFLFRGPNRLTP